MPELPEVETVRRILSSAGINQKKIEKIEIFNSRLVKDISENQFTQLLSGEVIHEIRRKGKYLFFILSKSVLISHLGMTGKYFINEKLMNEEQRKNRALILYLEKSEKLIYSDSRGFGSFRLQKLEEYKKLDPYKNIGTDLLDDEVNIEKIFNIYKKRKVFIKVALLEQNNVSGNGNIYASESLYKAGIHPLKRTNELTYSEIEKIFNCSRSIIKEATELGGTSVFDFINPQAQKGSYQFKLKVYDRDNLPCYSCYSLIIKKEINKRSSFFCPKCQA